MNPLLSMTNAGNEQPFETERLLIEPLTRTHAVPLFELLQDANIYHYIPTKLPKTIDELTNRYIALESRTSPDKTELWLNWAVRIKDKLPPEYIGRIEATVYPDRTADMAYILSSKYWGAGYATEMCLKLIDILMKQYQVKKIVVNVETLNAKSIALLDRLGFELIEEVKNADFFNGRQSDEYVFQLCL